MPAPVLRPALVGQRRLDAPAPLAAVTGSSRRPRRPLAGDQRLAAPAAAARHRAAGDLGGRLRPWRPYDGARSPAPGWPTGAHRGPRRSRSTGAQAATAAYPGFVSHPFPDLLRLRHRPRRGRRAADLPGRRGGPTSGAGVAAAWTPHPSVAEDWHTYVDDLPATPRCRSPGRRWTASAAGPATSSERPMVLGTDHRRGSTPCPRSARSTSSSAQRAASDGPQDLHRRDALRLRRRGRGGRRARLDRGRPGRRSADAAVARRRSSKHGAMPI